MRGAPGAPLLRRPSDADRTRRLRLAAQRLIPETRAPSVAEALSAVVGIQAQDTRAAALSLRSRVTGLEPAALTDPALVRTWTVRGTVHLHRVADLPWLHALTGPRNRRTFEAIMRRREALATANGMREDIVDALAREPLTRAALLAVLAERGHSSLGDYAVNVFAPWAAAHGLLAGTPDGRLTAAPELPQVEEEEALANLGARYRAGYGPVGAEDLAKWSGLGLGLARRALALAPDIARDEAPPPPPLLLLAGFDALMLGWRDRSAFATEAQDARILRGGGIIRPVVLVRGRAAGTWRLEGQGPKRRVAVEWFARPGPARALAAEEADVLRFLTSG